MSKSTFSGEEIQAEHERRRYKFKEELAQQSAEANCIHCGMPFNTRTAQAGKHGLCDYCLHKD